MTTEPRAAMLSPMVEQLLEQHKREVIELRANFGHADPGEPLASFVRKTFPLDALLEARAKVGKGSVPADDQNAEATERDRDE